jgi:hypothetical protein
LLVTLSLEQYLQLLSSFFETVSLCSPGWPETQDSPASASKVPNYRNATPHPTYHYFIIFMKGKQSKQLKDWQTVNKIK